MATHYEILGVQVTSKPDVIEAAYKALIKKYHPDRVGDNARVRQINAAYAVLKDPAKRKAYEVTLKPVTPSDAAVETTVSRTRPPDRTRRSSDTNGRAGSARGDLTWLLIGIAAVLALGLIFGPVHARVGVASSSDPRAVQ